MGQSPAEKEADIQRFKEAFKGEIAPEFSEPLVFERRGETRKEIPYILTKLEKESDRGPVKAVFEAKKEGEDEDGGLFRVDYDNTYGLKVRRDLYLFTPNLETVDNAIIYGNVQYKSGPLAVVLAASYSVMGLLDPLVAGHQLRITDHFDASILVIGDKPNIPRLADMGYGIGKQIPLWAEFPLANFEEALAGSYDIRKRDNGSGLEHESTYFQWENLVGAKIGRSKFKDEGTWLRYSAQLAGINQKEWVQIKDTPYLGKMTHSHDRSEFGRGRLRFHRKDEDGELWMFSVPEWLDKADFLRDLQGDSLESFLYHYPVMFWVKQKGQDLQRVSTYWRRDLPR